MRSASVSPKKEDEIDESVHGFKTETELESALLSCLPEAKPFGRHRHFRILDLQRLINARTGVFLPLEDLWELVGRFYDVDILDEMVERSPSRSLPSSPKVLSPLHPPPNRADLLIQARSRLPVNTKSNSTPPSRQSSTSLTPAPESDDDLPAKTKEEVEEVSKSAKVLGHKHFEREFMLPYFLLDEQSQKVDRIGKGAKSGEGDGDRAGDGEGEGEVDGIEETEREVWIALIKDTAKAVDGNGDPRELEKGGWGGMVSEEEVGDEDGPVDEGKDTEDAKAEEVEGEDEGEDVDGKRKGKGNVKGKGKAPPKGKPVVKGKENTRQKGKVVGETVEDEEAEVENAEEEEEEEGGGEDEEADEDDGNEDEEDEDEAEAEDEPDSLPKRRGRQPKATPPPKRGPGRPSLAKRRDSESTTGQPARNQGKKGRGKKEVSETVSEDESDAEEIQPRTKRGRISDVSTVSTRGRGRARGSGKAVVAGKRKRESGGRETIERDESEDGKPTRRQKRK